jgi:hypothetical protein
MSAIAPQSLSSSPVAGSPVAGSPGTGSRLRSPRSISACAVAAAALVGAGAYAATRLDSADGQPLGGATLHMEVLAPSGLGGFVAARRPVAIVRDRYSSARAADAAAMSPGAGSRTERAVATFPVSGVPGAEAASISAGRTVILKTIYPAGGYDYVVSARLPGPSHGAPTRSQLSSAAAWLYLAGNGCVVPAHQGRAAVRSHPVHAGRA